MVFKACCIPLVLLLMGGVSDPVQDSQGEGEKNSLTFSVWGVDLPVDNIDKAVEFYTETMGFTRDESTESDDSAVLDNGGLKLIFHETDKPIARRGSSHLTINLSVSNLGKSAEAAFDAGAEVLDGRPLHASIGNFVRVVDPWGNSVHLIKLFESDIEEGDPHELYNLGLHELEFEYATNFLQEARLFGAHSEVPPQGNAFSADRGGDARAASKCEETSTVQRSAGGGADVGGSAVFKGERTFAIRWLCNAHV